MWLRTVLIAASFLALLGVLGWFFISPMLYPQSPVQILMPEDQKQNAEHLIEVRSQNVKNQLDQTREKVQKHQSDLDDALHEQ